MIPPQLLPESLDRLVTLERGVRATAVRNIPATLSIFDSHFPRFAVLPGVLLLQSMTSVARLVAGGDGWRLHSAHTVRFRRFVCPGDHVLIHASVVASTAGTAELLDGSAPQASLELTASAEVDGQVVAAARRLVLRRDPGEEPACDG